MKRIKSLFSVIGIFLLVLINSVVYAVLNTEMFIDGDAYVRVDRDIRVTGIRVVEQVGGSYETYNCDYSKNTTSLQVTLPSSASSIVYEVTITNKGDMDYEVSKIIEESYSNSDIRYELIDLKEGTVINNGVTYTFKIKLTTTSNDLNNQVTLVLNYVFESLETEWTFDYTGNSQEFTFPMAGDYKIELWGGGENGGYTAGVLTANQNEKVYIYVGQVKYGQASVSASDSGLAYNGGGSGDYFNAGYRISGGSGATDIRLVNGEWNNFNSLKSRIMVAAGGGSCVNGSCAGGGLIGYTAADYRNGTGGTQIAGGSTTSPATAGSFGKGGNGYIQDKGTVWTNDGFGAGGGYFGGGGGYGGPAAGGANRRGSGGGGSSFISGHAGSVAIKEESTEGSIIFRNDHNDVLCSSSSSTGYNALGYNTDYTCSLHYSGIYFINTVMIDGVGYSWTTQKNEQIGLPTHDGTNDGNGYARITLIAKK